MRDPAIPSWYADSSFYANNPNAHKAALARWSLPVTTPEERLSAQTFKMPGETFPCHKCGKFAFERPKLCFWCRRGIAT